MQYLVTAKQMQEYDRNTIEHFKIPGIVLMERAALACVDVILKRQEKIAEMMPEALYKRKTLVVAGCGNNGGDGLAIARLLMQEGYPVCIWLVGNPEKMTDSARCQLESLQAYGKQIIQQAPDEEFDIIVDALFGVGLTRPLEGIYEQAVRYINDSDAFVLAVDIPSGIHADTGAVMGKAVYADVTVSFGFRKLGTFLYPGVRHTGQLIVKAIGITQDSFLENRPHIFTMDQPIKNMMPIRCEEGNKGTFGKVCLIAGSEGMAGAALLAGNAVFAAGAGMLRIVTPEDNRVILQTALPEAMTSCYQKNDAVFVCNKACGWADVIAAGPGLSTSLTAGELLAYCIENVLKPTVLDADAINLLAQNRELLEKLTDMQHNRIAYRPLVLTPHPGELARLEGCSIEMINKDPMYYCQKWSQALKAAVLCKNARTMIGAPDGRIYVNGSGNSGMATAGSGDVLTGIIAGLLAQGMDAFEAACVGVYLHGLAGDKAAHDLSAYSMKAQDIIGMTAALLAE